MAQLAKQFSMVGPGMVMGPCAATVFCEGMPVSLIGDSVSPHGEPPHSSSMILLGSFSVFADMFALVAYFLKHMAWRRV